MNDSSWYKAFQFFRSIHRQSKYTGNIKYFRVNKAVAILKISIEFENVTNESKKSEYLFVFLYGKFICHIESIYIYRRVR